MPRVLKRTWKDADYNWRNRVRWYELGREIILVFEDHDGNRERTYDNPDDANSAWEQFKSDARSSHQ